MPEGYCMYLRKSRADMDAEARGEGETLSRHQNMLLELAKKRELTIVKVYKEIVSGDSIAARPEMQKMLADITEKKYAGVLVVEIERLARGDTIDQGIVAQAFRESGTKIITPVKTYDPDNEFDEEYFEFSLFMSRREYKTIKRRMQAGRLASVKEGNYISTTAPYGYRKINPEPKVHTLEIIPEEAEIVKLIYNLYLGGHGAQFIANELNRMGTSPQKSQFWESPSIKKILDNPLYCGKVGWKTKSNGDTLYKGLHEPIISEETFNAVQQKRKTNPAAQLHPNDKLLNYYHGVMHCQNCGHQLRRRYIAKYGYEHLLCTHRECRGKVVSASFESVDEAVLSAFRYRIQQLEEQLASADNKQKTPVTAPDRRTPIKAELEKAYKQQSKLYDLLEQDIYDTNTFITRNKIISDKIVMLETALRDLDEEQQPSQLPPEEAISRLRYVVENFIGSGPEDKHTMLLSVVSKIWYCKTQRMCYRKDTSDLKIQADFL